MRQVLFNVPFLDLPIFGYGTMLFMAFVFCGWLARRLARREGVKVEILQDLNIWIFIFGIIGARITFIIQFPNDFKTFGQYFAIWDGGLVFYGSAIGAVIGYFIIHALYLKKQNVSTWKIADIVAPCVALGLCLGRVGCLLNGCCYGNVACPDCPGWPFPLAAAPRVVMTERGYQTAAGFTLKDERQKAVVDQIEPGSKAAGVLRSGDQLVRINGQRVADVHDVYYSMRQGWPRGKNDIQLTVDRQGVEMELAPFGAWTIPLHPTQIYESISMGLLLFFLLSYYPYKKRDGSVMVLFMSGYGVHRFLNEMLRTDNIPVFMKMTLSQNLSLVVLLAAAILALCVWRRGPGAAALQPAK